MYFSNVIGKSGVGRFARTGVKFHTGSVFENDCEDVVEGGVIVDGDTIRVVGGDDSRIKEHFGEIWHERDDKAKEKKVQLADTPENPLIWCLTDKVTLLENTRTYFKFIPINADMFLFCLVEGVCKLGSDGIPLIRNINPVEERDVEYTYTCKDLCSYSSVHDKETGYNMVMNVVHAKVIHHRESNRKIQTVKECLYMITDEPVKAYKAKQEAIKAEKERKRAEELELRRAAEAKAKKMEAEKEKKADVTNKAFPNSTGVKNSGKDKGLDQGAAAFLQMFSKG